MSESASIATIITLRYTAIVLVEYERPSNYDRIMVKVNKSAKS